MANNEQVTNTIKRVNMNITRDNIIGNQEGRKLNTYYTFHKFAAFNDLYPKGYDESNGWKEYVSDKGGTGKPTVGENNFGSPAARSIFNKSSAVMVGGDRDKINNPFDASDWRLSNNVPLMDSPNNRHKIRVKSGCSVKELVDASRIGELGVATYSYSDFMYCKHLGKIPNNYLITLRRFPIPVTDFISALSYDDLANNVGRKGRKKHASKLNPPVGTMVTWIGTPGNEMTNLLKYSVKMPYEWKDSQYNQISGGADDQTGVLNSIASAFDSKYRVQYMNGTVGGAFNSYMGKFFPGGPGNPPYSIDSLNSWRDENKVYGPVDAIKGTYMRGSKGLEFDQKITLQFDYELRSYNGINPRQAMLDLLSNILTVTYSTGSFWGGGYIGGGASQNNIFANLNIFKMGENKCFTDYVTSFITDFGERTEHIVEYWEAKGGFKGLINMAWGAINALGGMFIGSALNKLGRPARVQAASLLSPAPVGFWHVTIGNPRHPIMSMGNMILLNTTIEHYGPLGLDDFPTGLRVICELERGKPRDSRDIEKIYMHGNDRIFSSMGKELERMYSDSDPYNTDNTQKPEPNKSDGNGETDVKTNTSAENINNNDNAKIRDTYLEHFGITEYDDIVVTAKEQEYGSQGATKKSDGGSSEETSATKTK